MKTRMLLCLLLLVLPACDSNPEPAAEPSLEPVAVEEVEEPEEEIEEHSLVLVEEEDQFIGTRLMGEAKVEGVMRFSWYDKWSEKAEEERALMMHFYLAEGEADDFPEIPDEHYDRTPTMLNFYGFIDGAELLDFSEVPDQTATLVESLDGLPESFRNDEQEYAEVAGTLTFEDLISIIECDSPNSMVRFKSFEPASDEDAHRELIMQIRNGDLGEEGC